MSRTLTTRNYAADAPAPELDENDEAIILNALVVYHGLVSIDFEEMNRALSEDHLTHAEREGFARLAATHQRTIERVNALLERMG